MFFQFVEKNQRGFSLGDLESIFGRFRLFGYDNSEELEPMPPTHPKYESNRQKLAEFMDSRKEELLEVFHRYSGSKEDNLCMSDAYNCLVEMIQTGEVLKVYENRADVEEMFFKVNSLKRFNLEAKHYFFKVLGVDNVLYPSVSYIDLTFETIWQLLDFILLSRASAHVEFKSESATTNLDDLKANLRHTIATYTEKLKASTSDLEKRVLRNTVESLKKELKKLEDKLKALDDPTTKARKRMNALKEVFDFYCKQHVKVGGVSNSFADIKSQLNNMALADWMCFCRDFRIKGPSLGHHVSREV